MNLYYYAPSLNSGQSSTNRVKIQISNGDLRQLSQYTELLNKIQSKKAKIAVIGLGYIGLPTAATFANLCFNVKGFDINFNIINRINKGELNVEEPGLKDIVANAVHNHLLSATDKASDALFDADVIITCVQTPLNREGTVDTSFLKSACQEIASVPKKGRLIIVQSTVPPNTISKVVIPTLEKQNGMKCGRDFFVAYCPERMAPGTGLHDLSENMRLIGGYDQESTDLASSLFRFATKGPLQLTNVSAAELSKLAENAFRYVNIAFANELALICKQLNVDVQEVIALANTHPRVNIHNPGCGAGGPCLSKDTNLLINSAISDVYKPKMLKAAKEINTNMPIYVAQLALNALKKQGKRFDTSRIAVLGTAYKGCVNDSRDSPSEGIIKELKRNNVPQVVFDPYCNECFGQKKVFDLKEAVTNADCIIIATDHKEFYNLNLAEIKQLMKSNPIIVDGRRTIKADEATSLGFDYITISQIIKKDKRANLPKSKLKIP
jgi:UDP-N-acetyl-D-mannosaminuronic acid dehydrogenase